MHDTHCIDCSWLSDSWPAVSFRKQKKVLALTGILICILILYRINFGLWNSNVNKKSWIHQKSKTGRSWVYIDLNFPANHHASFIINIIWIPAANTMSNQILSLTNTNSLFKKKNVYFHYKNLRDLFSICKMSKLCSFRLCKYVKCL